MKNNYIIPIFISHKGCPNQCTFCNQRKISGSLGEIDINKIRKEIEEWIHRLQNDKYLKVLHRQIAFFGGSFTGIDINIQKSLLELANEYIDNGNIDSIRISTRPDYINDEILKMLKDYNVDTIELGIQSMDNQILQEAKRGHTSEDVKKACKLINQYGFCLGVQMMIGLKESTLEKEINTCMQLIDLKPKIARIYPVLVIKDTELEEQFNRNEYKALDVVEAVNRSKEVLKLFNKNNIDVIRIGLQATDNIAEGKDVVAGPFHPAFGQLVKSEIIYDEICQYLEKNKIINSELSIEVNPSDVSTLIGNKKINIIRILQKFNVKIKIIKNENQEKEKIKIL